MAMGLDNKTIKDGLIDGTEEYLDTYYREEAEFEEFLRALTPNALEKEAMDVLSKIFDTLGKSRNIEIDESMTVEEQLKVIDSADDSKKKKGLRRRDRDIKEQIEEIDFNTDIDGFTYYEWEKKLLEIKEDDTLDVKEKKEKYLKEIDEMINYDYLQDFSDTELYFNILHNIDGLYRLNAIKHNSLNPTEWFSAEEIHAFIDENVCLPETKEEQAIERKLQEIIKKLPDGFVNKYYEFPKSWEDNGLSDLVKERSGLL